MISFAGACNGRGFVLPSEGGTESLGSATAGHFFSGVGLQQR